MHFGTPKAARVEAKPHLPAWRNNANPRDADRNGSVNGNDYDAIYSGLPRGYGETYDYLLSEVDEIHTRTHQHHDEAFLSVLSEIVPTWQFGGLGNDQLSGFTGDEFQAQVYQHVDGDEFSSPTILVP